MKENPKKPVTLKTLDQHIEEECAKSPGFKRLFEEETARLELGYKIYRLRKMRKLSQKQLARKIHTSQQMISRIEDASNIRISLKTLAKVAAALKARLSVDLIPET